MSTMKIHKHEWTAVANSFRCSKEDSNLWDWCIRCGKLKPRDIVSDKIKKNKKIIVK